MAKAATNRGKPTKPRRNNTPEHIYLTRMELKQVTFDIAYKKSISINEDSSKKLSASLDLRFCLASMLQSCTVRLRSLEVFFQEFYCTYHLWVNDLLHIVLFQHFWL